jgi:serine/threonine protein kinase
MYKLFQRRPANQSPNQDSSAGGGGFKKIEILEDQILGIGSYGKVCKAKCDDLLCAAKIIHPTLFDPIAHQQIEPHKEHRLPTMRFEQECEILRTLRHPNIVLFLGMHEDPSNHLPVLLMELMDESLTHFLESSPQPIPYHIQVNICHDVTRALSFLHSNKIVHRDLSGNNVLLIGNAIAKVTDFGMARLSDRSRQATKFTFTMCPGTDVYMPPEAVQDKPVYTEKIDCFSFGVIVVQILTRQFPMPGDRRKTIKAGNMLGLEQRVSEIERRHNHISRIEQDHPLRPVVLDCLKDKDVARPFAHQLSSRIAALKDSPKYAESVTTQLPSMIYVQMLAQKEEIIASKSEENSGLKQELNEMQGELQASNERLEEKEQQNFQLEQSLTQLTETLDTAEKEFKNNLELNKEQTHQQLKEKDQVILEKEKQITITFDRLKACEKAMTALETQFLEAERQLKQKQQHLKSLHPEAQPLDKLLWQVEGMKVPCEMNGLHDAITSDGAMVYMRQSNELYAYNTLNQEWSRLPDCRLIDCALVVIKNLLTTVGGYVTNKLFSLAGKDDKKIWNEQFPPMPTQRWRTTALCTETALVVAGGMGEGLELLMTVEVMSTGLHEWSTAASLPELLGYQSMAVCGDHVYMLGGVDKSLKPTSSVYTCSLNALISSGRKSLGARFRSLSSPTKPPTTIWSRVADLPVKRSTCVSFRGRLLVIGGEVSHDEPSTVVYVYNPITDYWKINSYMTVPRRKCYATAVSEKQVLVIGGTLSRDTNMEFSSS